MFMRIAQYQEEIVTVTTCCAKPLNSMNSMNSKNETWCDGMYSQSENIQFKYGSLECEDIVNGSFNAGSVWEGDGFFPNYFLKYEDGFYSPNDYCLHSLNEEKIEVKICKPQCESDKLCLPKCCNLWDDVSFTNNTVYCVPSLEEKVWKPEIHDINNYYSKVELVPSNVHFFVSDPSKTAECTTVRLIQYQHFDYKILKNGEVAWTSSDVLDWYQIPKGRFCVDRELSDGDDDEASGRIVLVGCLEDFIPKINDSLTLVDTINFVLIQISLGFLALTLIIYVLLRGHQNVHSWTQFSYFFALWSNLLLASIIYYQTYEDANLKVANEGAGQPRGPLCFTASVVSTFLHNATLTTMVALAVDVFSMFHQLLNNGEQKMSKTEFLKRQALAWMVALTMTLVGLSLYFSNGSMHAPPYGYTNCKAKFWLADEILEAICHLVTASLFLVTISRICLVHLRGKEELVKINEQRNYSRALSLFFKLLVVMGMAWASIFLSYVLVKSTIPTIKWLFTLMEFSVSLQGFVIFLMFAFNRQTLDSLGENYSIIRKLSNASSTSSVRPEEVEAGKAVVNNVPITAIIDQLENHRTSQPQPTT
ncbi:G-protein coupled receptor Mth2 [Folsomia candida]|uniref:G-protein coupled receptor Mth2 n=1 Tax=Folsomia candida TaxID=158441 RepID=A0A226EHH2_FOLCA|nr:G-protein coupled receptor Mth2 [Folsomia candida]